MSDKILKTLNGYTIYDEEARTRITSIEKDYASTDYVDEAVSQPVNALADGKVDKNQGTENNGKFLGVVDGYLVLVDAPSGTSGTTDVVRCVAQELTEEQQEQVRANIGAASMTEFSALSQEKVDQTQLTNAVNDALTQAKASGEFDGVDGKNGSDGEDGEDGFSPIATVTPTTTGVTISITDKNGTTTATITNGKDGKDGSDGKDGQDGYTPQKGVDYFDGEDGQNGSNGKDGVSPTVSVSAITGGNRITITDKNGTKNVDVMNGSNGKDGSDGKDGQNGKDGSDYVLTDADKAEIAEMIVYGDVTAVPDYWVDELDTKADVIQTAMEKAGRKKSAFLWYTDAHWINGNSKMSPVLLNYLYMYTSMNKVNFGGDIIGDTLLATRDEMKYLYEWRKAIKDLPNHHSVFGNHDMFELDSVDYEDDNYRYAFLLAPEETPNMIWGDGNYYYIDNPSEKTRYLYIAYMTSDHTAMTAQGQFIVDAIKSVQDGWHIVAINHRWWQYSSSSTPTTGSIPSYEAEILSIFDTYNARGTRSGSNYFTEQNFSDAKGKVEFCIGGHIHVDYDFFTGGGIPVIITTADTNQNRVPDSTVDSGTVGTITESAVFGIVADYNEEVTKITVVGVGRGTSRVVRASSVKPTSISNITYSGDTTVGSTLEKSKFSFTVNYSDGSTSSVNGASTVTPTTIGVVGNNSVTITYVENGITLNGTVTIVGKEKAKVNLFNKNDPDMLDRGRINSSHNAVAYADNQLVTGFIEAKIGDTFTIETDCSNTANNYVGAAYCWNENKAYVGGNMERAVTAWTWSNDNKKGVFTIPSTYQFTTSNIANFEGTAYIRFCLAYTNMDNIKIYKN